MPLAITLMRKVDLKTVELNGQKFVVCPYSHGDIFEQALFPTAVDLEAHKDAFHGGR